MGQDGELYTLGIINPYEFALRIDSEMLSGSEGSLEDLGAVDIERLRMTDDDMRHAKDRLRSIGALPTYLSWAADANMSTQEGAVVLQFRPEALG